MSHLPGMDDLNPEHAALVDLLYATWRDEGLEGLRPAVMHDEIVWQPAPGAPEPGPFRGPDEIVAVAGKYIAGFGKFRPVPNRVFQTSEPDEVLVLATLTATEREMGNFTVPIGHLIQFRDDKVIRFEEIANQVEALAAAGLDPDSVTPQPTRAGGIVDTLITAFNDRDVKLGTALFAPDSEIDALRSAREGEVYRGSEGALRFWTDINELFGQFRVEDPEVLVRKSRALVVATLVLGGRESGAVTKRPVAVYVETDHVGLVGRFATNNDVEAARRDFEAG